MSSQRARMFEKDEGMALKRAGLVEEKVEPKKQADIVFIRVCFTVPALSFLNEKYCKSVALDNPLLEYSPLATGAELDDMLTWPRLERPETAYGMCCAINRSDFPYYHRNWRAAIHILQRSRPDEPTPSVVQVADTDRVAEAYDRAVREGEYQNWQHAFESLYNFVIEAAQRLHLELEAVALLEHDQRELQQMQDQIAREKQKAANRLAGIEKAKATRAAKKRSREEKD